MFIDVSGGPAHGFHKAVLANVLNQNHERLGDAILAGQRAYAQTGLSPSFYASTISSAIRPCG